MPQTPEKSAFDRWSDEELAKKAQTSVDFFAPLIDRFEAPLKRYILRISDFSPTEAEEILQEVFIKVWRNLREFDETVKFSSWIYRITHNETISHFRKEHARGRAERAIMDDEIFENLPAELDLPAELNRKLNGEFVRKLLALLPLKYREVLILKFLEQKDYEEISDILKKPLGTVGTLINRAKQALKEAAERQKITFTF